MELSNRQIIGTRRGRPRLDIPNPVVQIRLSPTLFDRLDRLARERDEPLARVIREELERRPLTGE